jgi:hypothetical protein
MNKGDEWPGIYASTTGIAFFGTPFRGAGGLNQDEMLRAAYREYDQDQVQGTTLGVLQPGCDYLVELVQSFENARIRWQQHEAQIACFYETKSSNVGKVVGKEDRIVRCTLHGHGSEHN